MIKAGVRTPVYTFTQIDSTDYNLILKLTWVSRSGQIKFEQSPPARSP